MDGLHGLISSNKMFIL